MNRSNPLFLENDDPVDVLNRIEFILCFLEEVHLAKIDQLEFSEEGKDGLMRCLHYFLTSNREPLNLEPEQLHFFKRFHPASFRCPDENFNFQEGTQKKLNHLRRKVRATFPRVFNLFYPGNRTS